MVKYIYSIGPRGPKLESMSLFTNDEIRWISFGKIYFRFRALLMIDSKLEDVACKICECKVERETYKVMFTFDIIRI